jgi:hypothetical protein
MYRLHLQNWQVSHMQLRLCTACLLLLAWLTLRTKDERLCIPSKRSYLYRATWRHIPEDKALQHYISCPMLSSRLPRNKMQCLKKWHKSYYWVLKYNWWMWFMECIQHYSCFCMRSLVIVCDLRLLDHWICNLTLTSLSDNNSWRVAAHKGEEKCLQCFGKKTWGIWLLWREENITMDLKNGRGKVWMDSSDQR